MAAYSVLPLFVGDVGCTRVRTSRHLTLLWSYLAVLLTVPGHAGVGVDCLLL